MNLTPTPKWSEIPQWDTKTYLIGGGPDAPLNRQAQALANRTEILGDRSSVSLYYVESEEALESQKNTFPDGAIVQVAELDKLVKKVDGVFEDNGFLSDKYYHSLSVLYRKKLHGLVVIPADIKSHWNSLGHAWFYAQAFRVDEDASEIFVWYMTSTGGILAIFDYKSCEYKKSFETLQANGAKSAGASENVVIRIEGGVRYAYVRISSNVLSKFPVDSIADKSQANASGTITGMSINVAFDYCDGYWYAFSNMTEIGQGGEAVRNMLFKYDDSSVVKGYTAVGIHNGGLSPATGGEYMPKRQGMHITKGKIFFGIGGRDYDAPKEYSMQGVRVLAASGSILEDALYENLFGVSKLQEMGIPATQMENEGIYVMRDGRILGAYETGVGLAIIDEASIDRDAIDFSAGATLPVFPPVAWEQSGHHPRGPDGKLYNSLTGDVFTSWLQIAEFMRQTGRSYFSYYSSGVTGITDFVGGVVPNSCVVTLYFCNTTTMYATLMTEHTCRRFRYAFGDATQFEGDNRFNTVPRPATDNTLNLGVANARFATVFAGTGTINTSDEREKTDWRDQSESEKLAALEIKGLISAYKFTGRTRTHFGVGAQTVGDVMRSHGLDPADYAFWCYDEWPEQIEVKDEEGNVIQEYQPAGNRYGIRYDELCMFILAAT